MPALRKPTAVLEASGAFQHDPKRRRDHEPDTGRGVGPPPDWLTEGERQAWDQLVADTAAGVWQSSDKAFLEQLARMLAKSREGPEVFGTKSMTLFVSMLARAGMTPADRSKVYVKPDGKEEKPKTGLASFR
jgi:hypothetical protein